MVYLIASQAGLQWNAPKIPNPPKAFLEAYRGISKKGGSLDLFYICVAIYPGLSGKFPMWGVICQVNS
jgi:hypothetical protein